MMVGWIPPHGSGWAGHGSAMGPDVDAQVAALVGHSPWWSARTAAHRWLAGAAGSTLYCWRFRYLR